MKEACPIPEAVITLDFYAMPFTKEFTSTNPFPRNYLFGARCLLRTKIGSGTSRHWKGLGPNHHPVFTDQDAGVQSHLYLSKVTEQMDGEQLVRTRPLSIILRLPLPRNEVRGSLGFQDKELPPPMVAHAIRPTGFNPAWSAHQDLGSK